MKIADVRADHYLIPLPVPLSDSTHGTIPAFEMIAVRVRDADGAEGVGYTYTVGTGGAAVHAVLARDLAPRLIGREAECIEELWQGMWWALHYGGRGGACGTCARGGRAPRSGACWAASTRACPATQAASISSSRSMPSCARPTTTWPAAFARSR
jgi:hypothetical protein